MNRTKQFINWCDKAMAFSFYALIYFLPISIALLEAFTGFALFFYLLKRGGIFYGILKKKFLQGTKLSLVEKWRVFVKAYKPVENVLNIPIIIFLVTTLLSVASSQYLFHSIEGFFGKILQSVFLYFNFIECIRTKKRLRIFLTVFLVSCTLICINGFYQSIVGHGFIFGHVYDGRISSSFRHANDFGAYLVVLVPVLFCLSFLIGTKNEANPTDSKGFAFLTSLSSRIILIVLFFMVLLSFGLTYSRGAWVGFILSLFLSGLFGFWIKERKIFVVFGVLALGFLLFFYPKMMQERTLLINIGTSLARNNRLVYWERSLCIIKDYPLTGCGLNTYALVEGRYSAGWGGYPHNSYLQMTAETGLIGVAAFSWMLMVLFYTSLRSLLRIKGQAHKMLFFGFLTGLLGFLIHSFFDTNFYSVQLGSFMWLIIGLIIVLQRTKEL